jgi:hypothetical protein
MALITMTPYQALSRSSIVKVRMTSPRYWQLVMNACASKILYQAGVIQALGSVPIERGLPNPRSASTVGCPQTNHYPHSM